MSKLMAAEKGLAVMEFVGNLLGAYEAGFTDTNTLDLATLYRCAQNHVKDNYDMETETLDKLFGPFAEDFKADKD